MRLFKAKRGLKQKVWKPLFLFLVLFLVSACSKKIEDKPRLGYLLNITHAVPIVAIEEGLFDDYHVEHFVSGGYLLTSLMSKDIDIAYIGPGPYINAIDKGFELELLTLSASGANAFVVNKKFQTDKNFKIKKIAVPQYGNTQDLLARGFIARLAKARKSQSKLPSGMMAIAATLTDTKSVNFADDVEFIAINPAELETVLDRNSIDAAMIAEPWGTMLSEKGFVNLSTELNRVNLISALEDEYESLLRKEINRLNTFPTTLLVVRKEYYESHPREVENLLAKQDYVLDIITLDTESAISSIQDHFKKIANKKLPYNTLKTALRNISFNPYLDYAKLDELENVALAAHYIKKKKILLAQSKSVSVKSQ